MKVLFDLDSKHYSLDIERGEEGLVTIDNGWYGIIKLAGVRKYPTEHNIGSGSLHVDVYTSKNRLFRTMSLDCSIAKIPKGGVIFDTL